MTARGGVSANRAGFSLDELESLLSAATRYNFWKPGDWRVVPGARITTETNEHPIDSAKFTGRSSTAHLAAGLLNSAPQLFRRIREAERDRDRLTRELDTALTRITMMERNPTGNFCPPIAGEDTC